MLCIESTGGGNPDVGSITKFYRKSDAQNAWSLWNELGPAYFAFLYDGASWTLYN